PPAYGSHPHWRILISDNWGNGSITLVPELEFLDGSGSVIAATGGTASASHGSGTAGSAFDNDGSTSWNSGSAVADQWLRYSYATAKPVEGVRFKAGTVTNRTAFPRRCQLQHSDDGSSWTT